MINYFLGSSKFFSNHQMLDVFYQKDMDSCDAVMLER